MRDERLRDAGMRNERRDADGTPGMCWSTQGTCRCCRPGTCHRREASSETRRGSTPLCLRCGAASGSIRGGALEAVPGAPSIRGGAGCANARAGSRPSSRGTPCTCCTPATCRRQSPRLRSCCRGCTRRWAWGSHAAPPWVGLPLREKRLAKKSPLLLACKQARFGGPLKRRRLLARLLALASSHGLAAVGARVLAARAGGCRAAQLAAASHHRPRTLPRPPPTPRRSAAPRKLKLRPAIWLWLAVRQAAGALHKCLRTAAWQHGGWGKRLQD